MAIPGDKYKHYAITDVVYKVIEVRDGQITIQREGESPITMRVEHFNKNYKKV